ncbi:MAG: hypothetical protein WBJ13_02775 [Sedimentibacter sp.]
MNKSFIKEINLIIKNMDNSDYICKVKYVIFFVCKILYSCKVNGFDILNDNFSSFKSKYVSNEYNMGIFVGYKKFNLDCSLGEEKIYELISTNKDVCTIKQGIITGLDKAFIVDEETIEKYKIENFLLRKWIKTAT